ncbi:MAG: ribosome assembly RNA-binding protein YhbY [Gammaproteobacteria bacterium]|nr:ribosome assembly RNA-binding protein YhbY [Gammaproteobacteria bacterium]
MSITEQQRRKLKKLVHHLKPVVIIGQKGLSEGVLNEIDIAMDSHELIKIKLSSGDRDDRQAMIDSICEQTDAEFIHSIGHIAALYRRHPKKPKIAIGS